MEAIDHRAREGRQAPGTRADCCEGIRRKIQSVVAIPEQTANTILTGLLAGGHVLIEGIPGVGKTLLARTLARCVDGEFRRIQFTNDLMPSDIVGSSVWRAREERFELVPGPLFANIVLADEINRTSPRTLSCLLEAMENGTVSIDGQNRVLGVPFFVLGTRNPIEFHGTYPVPEAALDRFMLRVELDYPPERAELDLYMGHDPENVLAELAPEVSLEQLIVMIAAVESVEVSEPVARYAYRLVQATRRHASFVLGASPRAAMMLLRACRARAFMRGRDYVLPDDIQELFIAALSHRTFVRGGVAVAPLLAEILASTPVEL